MSQISLPVEKICINAGLTDDNISRMLSYLEGEDEFYGSEAYGQLYEYFIDEMPYSVQKCREDTPDNWILNRLEILNESR